MLVHPMHFRFFDWIFIIQNEYESRAKYKEQHLLKQSIQGYEAYTAEVDPVNFRCIIHIYTDWDISPICIQNP